MLCIDIINIITLCICCVLILLIFVPEMNQPQQDRGSESGDDAILLRRMYPETNCLDIRTHAAVCG